MIGFLHFLPYLFLGLALIRVGQMYLAGTAMGAALAWFD